MFVIRVFKIVQFMEDNNIFQRSNIFFFFCQVGEKKNKPFETELSLKRKLNMNFRTPPFGSENAVFLLGCY